MCSACSALNSRLPFAARRNSSPLPTSSHDSRRGVRIRSEEQMSKLVGHNTPQNVREADIPGRLSLEGPVVEDIAVAARSSADRKACAEDLVCPVPASGARCAPRGGLATRLGTVRTGRAGAGVRARPAGRRPAVASGSRDWRAFLARRGEGDRVYMFPGAMSSLSRLLPDRRARKPWQPSVRPERVSSEKRQSRHRQKQSPVDCGQHRFVPRQGTRTPLGAYLIAGCL